tara:strand:- start:2355 stop:2684 length:330 start_codon:yes stop_codon:yes gene_type:complete
MSTKEILSLITTLFIVMVIMLSANNYGPSLIVLLSVVAMLTLIEMSFLDLDSYINEEGKFQFPGVDDSSVVNSIKDIVKKLIVTMVIVAYLIKSGIFKMSNFNPMNMYM